MAALDSLKTVRQRKYLGRDFDTLRAMLLEYARLYYPTKIRDFSDSSVGGMLLDMAAYVGDNLSFYLDHQFSELDPDDAVENINIERALKQAGVSIVGAAPANVLETFFVSVPAKLNNNVMGPDPSALPVIKQNTVLSADNGTLFTLVEDVDFTKTNTDGTLKADVRIGKKTPDGTPQTFVLASDGTCISGQHAVDTFSLGSFVPFRRLTLSQPNVSQITSVVDSLGNTYYEVAALTHDVVYQNFPNPNSDVDVVKDSIRTIPAPYRFIKTVDLTTRLTTLIFGGGNANTLEDDVIPDPADFAIPFKYTQTFSRIQVNPEQLMSTKTLGVASANVTLTVQYRHGGGLNNNVDNDQITNVVSLQVAFPGNPTSGVASTVRTSVQCTNKLAARDGDDAPTVDQLKAQIPSMRNMQERIVTRQDLLARVHSLPSNFGRVYRASVSSSSNNPLATQLHIVSRAADGTLTTSSDTLKKNLVSFLNPYRMISDAIDVLDARIIDLKFNFEIVVDPTMTKSIVLQNVLRDLQQYFDVKNFNINQPIVLDDVRNFIFGTRGVVSITSLKFTNLVGVINNKIYSNESYDVTSNTLKGYIIPPLGGIFEIRYPSIDIVGRGI